MYLEVINVILMYIFEKTWGCNYCFPTLQCACQNSSRNGMHITVIFIIFIDLRSIVDFPVKFLMYYHSVVDKSIKGYQCWIQ